MQKPSWLPSLEHIARWAGSTVLVLVFAACSPGEEPASPGTPLEAVTGSLNYAERTGLTDAAIAAIELVDVSADGAAEVVSAQRIRNPGQLPVHFKLEYPLKRIDPARRYTVQARIFEGEQVVFATDTAYPVITQGNPRIVELAMIPIGADARQSSAIASEPPLAGSVTNGNITANYTARFEDGKLASIQEERDEGAAGKAGAEFQFKEGRLLRYVELGRRSNGSGRAATAVALDFVFDDTGELLAATKTVDDAGAKPEPEEIDAARNRAELLRNHALALKASRDHAQ